MFGWSIGSGDWMLVVYFAIAVIWPIARICKRAGLPTTLSIMALVPILNLALLFFVAFAPWPALPDGE